MKRTLKMAKIGMFEAKQRFYCESFDNYVDFVHTLRKRQNEKPFRKIEDAVDCSFAGIKNIQEGFDLLENGWDKPVEAINRKFSSMLDHVTEKVDKVRFRDVQGFAPSVPSALMGLPRSMYNQRKEVKKTKILNFLICIDRAWNVSNEQIVDKMTEQLATIAKLERDCGYRCRISVMFAATGGYTKKGTMCSCVLKVKDESQPFDIKRLAFPVCHSAMLREMMFAWEGTLNAKGSLEAENYSDYHENGMGTSFEHWSEASQKDFINALNEGNQKTIVFHFKTDLDEALKSL